MKRRRCSITLTVIGIVSVMASTAALADCVDGVRKATPAEVAYFQKVQGVLKEVLPPAPTGWTFTRMGDRTLDGLCKETPEGGFSITVDAKYTYRPSKEEADRMNAESGKIQGEIDALEKLPPEADQRAKRFHGEIQREDPGCPPGRPGGKEGTGPKPLRGAGRLQ